VVPAVSRVLATVLLGVFKGERFGYARTAVIDGLNISFLVRPIAEDIRCVERVEDLEEVTLLIEGIGTFLLDSVCVVDRAVLNGYEIPYTTVFHVARILSGSEEYEAYIGSDIIRYWHLYLDPLTNTVRSAIGKRVRWST
jgi:hypothetical protein